MIECKVLHKSLEQTIRQGLEQTAGHLVIFDRTEQERWDDRLFRREERTDADRTITVWGM